MPETVIADISHTRSFAEFFVEITRGRTVKGQTVPFGKDAIRFDPLTADFLPLNILKLSPL